MATVCDRCDGRQKVSHVTIEVHDQPVIQAAFIKKPDLCYKCIVNLRTCINSFLDPLPKTTIGQVISE